MARLAQILLRLFGLPEIGFILGMWLLWHGLRDVYPPAAPITCGTVFVVLSIAGVWRASLRATATHKQDG